MSRREVTIQVRAAAGRDIETEVAKTVAIARAFPGVAEVRPLFEGRNHAVARAMVGERTPIR